MNSLGRTVSKQAMYELRSARSRDEAECAAVFEALEIDGKKHKKLRGKILQAYSNVVSGGSGHIKQLFEEWGSTNSREYMKRTFAVWILVQAISDYVRPLPLEFHDTRKWWSSWPTSEKGRVGGKSLFWGEPVILRLRRQRMKYFILWTRRWACLRTLIIGQSLKTTEI